ncbi:MAG TPA: hypothetical protein DDZ80_32620 [Cyanobacteria bacterium UBA8803]|nr:hypothetical protein [Cyanobacteria bacterium UBA9273]HBL62944.1 hypothetical protein [Cyanobacteria bacterium UBA8803]
MGILLVSITPQAWPQTPGNFCCNETNKPPENLQRESRDSIIQAPTPNDPAVIPTTEVPTDFRVFPVGLNVGGRPVFFSILIRGQQDGTQAVNFAQWLVPFDAVVGALKLNVTPLPDGQLEVRSPIVVTRLDPQQLTNDPELGLVFSIQQLQTLLGVPAEFDINEFAIQLNLPQAQGLSGGSGIAETPVQLEGLPQINAPNVTATTLEQRVNVTGSPSSTPNLQGELLAVGTLLDGSWYLRVNQPDLQNSSTWTLAEAQYLQQTDYTDLAIGFQPTFWNSRSGNYWGVTAIRRQGFTPPSQFGGGGFVPGQRLQASQVGRTIVGKAEPGTLVRLTQGFGDRFIDEVLVDSSGIYRFEDVPVGGRTYGGNYRILLYPEGRLTAAPEVREATFSNVPGQIPSGTSATIVSLGVGRQFSGGVGSNFIGEFTDIRGGIAQRWGVTDSLTLGAGAVYDKTARGLGELFFRPGEVPFEAAISILTPDEEGTWDINSNIFYRASPSLSASFSSDRFTVRLNIDWQLFPGFTLLGLYDNLNGATVGVQTGFSRPGAFTFARATLDGENRLRWTIRQRLGDLEFSQQGNEIGTVSELDYNLSGNVFLDTGHSLILGYETRNATDTAQLLTLGWRYRSQARTPDGRFLWETQLGYGISSQGSGPIASLQTAVIPGLLVQGRYQGTSVTSKEDSYSLEVLTSFNLQDGIFPGDRHSDRFRTKGGLLIQPFFDRNHNGKQDAGESSYTETADLLLILNNQPIKASQPEVQSNRVLIRLSPGTYRLDLDPAGFPPDWQSALDAYAVEVVAGSYTLLAVPLIRSYTLAGIVADTAGNPIAGARVEAISTDGVQRRFSVTNSAGVYYLERLSEGKFKLQINGKPAQPDAIALEESSEPLQELNLKLQ